MSGIEDIKQKLGGILSEAAQSVFPMLLPKQITISVAEIKQWQPQGFPDPMVLITTSFAEGPSGSMYFLLPTRSASTIVDLMLGGEGAATRSMNEESVDAVKEVMNQMLGVTASGLRDSFSGKYTFDQVEVHSLEAEMDLGLLLDDGETTMVELSLAIDGHDPFALSCCFPETTIQPMASGGGGAAPAAEAPAAAKKPEFNLADVDVPSIEAFGDFGMSTAMEPAKTTVPAEKEQFSLQGAPPNMELILDIDLPIIIRLGSTQMTLKEIMRMSPGSIIELDKGVDEPVELLVNDQPIARGEVVVVEGNFAFRVTEIESKTARIKTLS